MKKHINFLAIGISVLILLYTMFRLIGHEPEYRLAFVFYTSFIMIFIFSVIYAFKKKWIPLIVQTITLMIVIIVAPLIRTEVNFYVLKKEREEIIQMLVDGEIKKEDNDFAYYYILPEYKKSVKSNKVRAAKHSEDEFYVFFQSADSSLFDFVGLTEGFVYSSTGKFPTYKKFDSYVFYKKIDGNWYFVSSDEDRFKTSCLFLCDNKIVEQSVK